MIFFGPKRMDDFFCPKRLGFFGFDRLGNFYCPERLDDIFLSREVG